MSSKVSKDTTVKTLLENYPQLMQIFMELRLKCAGCPTEAFHSLEDIAHEYNLSLDHLLDHFNRVLEKDEL